MNQSNADLTTLLAPRAPHTRRKRFLIVIAGALVITAAVTAFTMLRPPDETARYVTTPLRRGDVRVTVTATGNLAPNNQVTVGSELSGVALEVHVETNDTVTAGQPLAVLDTAKLEQQTASSRAQAAAAAARVAQAIATRTENETSLERLRKLHQASGGKLPAQSELDAAIAALARAEADLAAAQADVEQTQASVMANESDLGKAIIRSPIDGMVLSRDLEPGQTVAASFTAPELFLIAETLENMKLEVAVAEADIGRVEPGQQARFAVDAWPERAFTATVRKVEFGSSVTDNVVTYTTELEVANNDLSLRPGMTATADILVTEVKQALLVPAAALRYQPAPAAPAAKPQGRSFIQSLLPGPPRANPPNRPAESAAPASGSPGEGRIWILRDGRPEMRPVRTGISDGQFTEISGEGLTEGMPVILKATQP